MTVESDKLLFCIQKYYNTFFRFFFLINDILVQEEDAYFKISLATDY